MAKNPLSIVKDKFGDKAKLVEAVKAFTSGDELWLGRLSSDRGKDRGLEHVSNAKLLRLHATFTAVKDQFGSRAKLIAAILDSEKRGKDEGYKKRLETYPVPRLFDAYKSVIKRSGGTAAKAGAPAAAKPAKAAAPRAGAPAEEKAAPKKAAAKKPASK